MKAVILDRIDLPHGAGAVTLYDWMAEEVSDGRNIVRSDTNGRELWRAEPALAENGREDFFTSMVWDGVALFAFTWSCYRVGIDLTSGAVTVLAFTK